MVKIYTERNLELEERSIPGIDEDTSIDPRSWIALSHADSQTLSILAEKTGLPPHFLMVALDEEETARLDTEDGAVLIVLDAPVDSDDDKSIYTTKPFIIAYSSSCFVTINQYDEFLTSDMLAKRKNIEPQKHVRTTLNLIYQMSKEFIYYLRQIDDQTKKIENSLHSSMRNKELFELMAINKSLVYFSTALSANKAVLQKLLKSPSYKKFEADLDLMEDTRVELDQAIEMCSIYRKIIDGMMTAFSSIISNNLNLVMKTLSVITIVISIPTLIASIYGMNFDDIPLAHEPWGFWVVIAIAVVLAIIGAVLLVYFTRKNRGKK